MNPVDYDRERDSSQLLELFDDHRRHAPEVAECFRDWFIGDEIAFAERYAEGHLKLAVRSIDIGPRYSRRHRSPATRYGTASLGHERHARRRRYQV
jgi:hypothetical protein